MVKKKIIIGNWKMAPASLKEAKATFAGIKKTAGKLHNVQTVVCAPFLYLGELKKMAGGPARLNGRSGGHRCAVGAQDSFWDSVEEAHTGEVSPAMLASIGTRYVILGHSEQRALGETNEMVSEKARACLKEGLIVVLCVGESQRDEEGEYTKFIKQELIASLGGVRKKDLKNVIIANEPIWAIGKRALRAAAPEDALETSIFIKKVLSDVFGERVARNVPIIYGGSVDPNNAAAFLAEGGADGLLVGRASLDAKNFGSILRIADSAIR